jgi:4-hydroxybenzoate polyprenyltransferase
MPNNPTTSNGDNSVNSHRHNLPLCKHFRQAKMVNYTEEQLLQALQQIHDGRSIRAVAKEWAIPKTTLIQRRNGTQPRADAWVHLQKLSKAQEERLTEWILTQVDLACPPTHAQIKELAQRILLARGDTTTIGKRWLTRFLDRNPVLKTQRSRAMEHARVNGATTEVIRGWFPHLAVPAIKAIKPANRWNMDEAGIMEGLGVNGLVVGRRERKAILKKQPGTRAWTSFIECISAAGRYLSPLVIFKGKSVQQQWFPLDLTPFKGWEFTATDNGWTNNAVAVEWLKKIFIPQTQPDDPSEYRLLILDGHGSHTSDDFMWLCFQHRIRIVYLPPHCSHVLQPLDLGVFSSLKTAYRKSLSNLATWSDSTIVGKRNFLEYYRRARLTALVYQNILSGWKATGLWPVSISKPLMNRLLVENTGNSTTTPVKEGHLDTPVLPGPPITPLPSGLIAQGLWTTPTKSIELGQQLDQFHQGNRPTRTHRQLFQKVTKAFDTLDYNMAFLRKENEALKAQLEAIKPRKRKRVDTDPNTLFAGIEAIHRAQVAVGAVEAESDDASENGESSDTGDCIVVGGKSRNTGNGSGDG